VNLSKYFGLHPGFGGVGYEALLHSFQMADDTPDTCKQQKMM